MLSKNVIGRLRGIASERVLVYLSCVLFSIAYGLWLGKDVLWDQINYHVYAGYTALDTRLDRDFMPASIQSYFNGLSFVPFAMAAASGMSSGYVAAIVALLQSVALWGCYEIARSLPRPSGRLGSTFAIAATALAALCPMYMIQMGSSANDVMTAVPIVAAWACMLRATHSPRRVWLLAVGGALLGAGTGLKLTNGIFAVSSIALFLAFRPARWREVALWILAGVSGFAIVDGWWAFKLWREFGSPLFPYFNGIFKSPDFPAYSMAASRRFMLTDWVDIVLLPFQLAKADSNRYIELSAPDVRYAVATIAMIAAGVTIVLRRRPPEQSRMILATLIMFLLGWSFWQFTSGAGRYMMPLALVVAPFLMSWTWTAGASPRVLVYGSLILITVQAMSSVLGTATGRTGASWSGPWIQVELPDELRQSPHLILTGTVQTYSAMIPFIHPDSSIVNVGGQSIIQPGSSADTRLRAFLKKFEGRVVFIDRVPPEPVHGDVQLFKYGLELSEDCKPMKFLQYFEDAKPAKDKEGPQPVQLTVCSVHHRAPPGDDYFQELAGVRTAASAIMKVCPEIFYPEPGEIDGSNGSWRITYPSRDAQILIYEGEIFLSNFFHPFYSPVGKLESWAKGEGTFACSNYPTAKSNDLSRFFTPAELEALAGKIPVIGHNPAPGPTSSSSMNSSEIEKKQ